MQQPRIFINRPVVVAIAVLLFLFAFISGVPIIFYLAYAVTAVILLAFFWTRRIARAFHMERTLKTSSVQVGDTVEEVFHLWNDSRLPMLWIELDDHSTLPGYTAAFVQTLDPEEDRHWTVQGVCARRGLYNLGPMTIRLGDPFGFFVAQIEHPAQTSLLVYPPLVELPGLVLPRGSISGSSRTSLRALEMTTDAAGVRDYRAGDSLSRIHWASTARRNRLQVKEFDLEPAGNLWIIADLNRDVQAGSGDESTEEYIVRLCSSLLSMAVRENKAVGFAAEGEHHHLIMPDKGARQLWRILRDLAAARAEGERPLADLLREVLPVLGRGMTVVVVTSAPSGDWIDELLGFSRHGLSVAVLLVDATSFGARVPPAGVTAGMLAMAGIPSYIIQQGQHFQTIGQERKKPVQRALGSGRVWQK